MSEKPVYTIAAFPQIMEVEIDPFQARLDNEFIVYYRNVWRDNQQFACRATW